MRGERTAAAPLRPHDPRRLGDYELVGRLGQGGMGTVYLARDPHGTLVAVKVVRADVAHDEEFRRRFRSEVDRARQVPPFCTAEVLDADPDHDLPYLVVEYVDGPSLAEVVSERGPLTSSNLHSVAIGVATALTAIHGAGVIHRDLKPRNVLLAPGSPKVIDFGIAKALEGNTSHTRTDQMVGTVAYMAPERFGPDPSATITPAADIFAWGAVVAYAGTGRTPFHADSPTATAARILTQPPDLSGLSGPLRDLVEHTLAKDPAHRPEARDLLNMLVTGPQRAAATTAALAHQPGLRDAAQRMQAGPAYPHGTPADPAAFRGPALRGPLPRRRKLLPALIVVLILALVAGTATILRGDLPWAFGALPGRSAAPAPSGPSSPPPTSAPPLRRTAVLSDALSAVGPWQETADADEKASCRFTDGALVAQRATPGSFRCRGPNTIQSDDLQIEVNVRLLAPGSCAAIWLRFRPYQGYQVRVCETAVLAGTHKSAAAQVLQTFPLDSPVAIGGPATRITVTTRDVALEVARDGRSVGAMPLADPDIGSGYVALGLFTEPGDARHTSPYAAAFDHVDIYTLTA
jgi:predicted Ser/Thr protein kinase